MTGNSNGSKRMLWTVLGTLSTTSAIALVLLALSLGTRVTILETRFESQFKNIDDKMAGFKESLDHLVGLVEKLRGN